MSHISAGIDFGTSNSTVGLTAQGSTRLVPLEGGHSVMPSALFFNFDDDCSYFGRSAVAHYTDGVDGRLMRALKSVLGTSLIGEKTRVKARTLTFSQILAIYIGHLKKRLEQESGCEVADVVLGRPVHFVDEDEAADRKAQDELEKAALSQGFRNILFQYEPIAAALSYEQRVTREELALVVDIGGGTSDFSIVRVSPERAKASERKNDILANTGVHIGGTDFDRQLSMAQVMPHFGYGTRTKDGKRELPSGPYFDLATWQMINMLYNNKAMAELREIRYEAAEPGLVDRIIAVVEQRRGHELAGRVEEAKIKLSEESEIKLALPFLSDLAPITLTRETFDTAIARSVGRIRTTIAATVEAAGVAPDRIGTVFFTGGSTGIPLVRRAVLEFFPGAAVVDGDMFGSVGFGLALDASRRFRS
ncbi:heat-shock protein [Agaricicola taiwanensis]|uniref:Heat-shock protein n=1 Tax=Agaricicola taiwanensis TaxID=591372 RepID=A0A8J2VS64_9RHOB|nr:Hsp70 family protein [Agaricicola taiwanensis]GGE39752.1 heat-shock protein [Agaricicola taiwanensis]